MQQINLYLPEFREKQEWLTANTIVMCAIGLGMLMALSAVLETSKLRKFEQQVVQIEKQLIERKERVDKIKITPHDAMAESLDQRIKTLQIAILSRQKLSEIIDSQNLGNADGFSESLAGLARQASSNISLDRIRLSRGGRYLELMGETDKPEQIARYIQNLQQEDGFTKVTFGLLSLAKAERSKRLHNFALGFDSVYQESDALPKDSQPQNSLDLEEDQSLPLSMTSEGEE